MSISDYPRYPREDGPQEPYVGPFTGDTSIWRYDPTLQPPQFNRLVFGVVIGLGAACLYLCSLGLPVLRISMPAIGGSAELVGWDCLGIVWQYPLLIWAFPAWWANVGFAAGLICLLLGRFGCAGTCGLVSLALALSFLPLNPEPLEAGYWAWLGSMAVLTSAGLVALPKLLAALARPPEHGPTTPRG